MSEDGLALARDAEQPFGVLAVTSAGTSADVDDPAEREASLPNKIGRPLPALPVPVRSWPRRARRRPAALLAVGAITVLLLVGAIARRDRPAPALQAGGAATAGIVMSHTDHAFLADNGMVRVALDLDHGQVGLRWPIAGYADDAFAGATGVLLRGSGGSGPAGELMAGDYATHRVEVLPLSDALGNGTELLFHHTDGRYPPLTQRIKLYRGSPGVMVQTEIGVAGGPILEVSRIDALRTDDPAAIALPGGMAGLVLALNGLSADHMPRQAIPLTDLPSDGSLPYVTALTDPIGDDAFLAGTLGASTWFPSILLRHTATGISSFSLANIGPAGSGQLLSEPFLLGRYATSSTALRAYAAAVGQAGPALHWPGGVQMGWSSWGAYELGVTAARVLRNAQFMADHLRAYGYDTIHIDDGWEQRYGDWLPARGFSAGMPALVSRIHALGLKASLWVAPFLAAPASWPARVHPEWLLRNTDGSPVNITINGPVYVLDVTNPAALAYIKSLCTHIRQWGLDGVKLDFLYTGSMEGQRYRFDLNGVQAYNAAMRLVRDTLEADPHHQLYLTGVQQGFLPSGYFHAWRVGRDIESRLNADHIPTWDLIRREALAVNTFAFADGAVYATDPDDLLLRGVDGARNLNADELQTYTTMVALGGTVWLSGDDLPQLARQNRLGYLTNPEVLAVVRAGRAGVPNTLIDQAGGPAPLWSSTQPDGSTVVGVFNWSDAATVTTVRFSDLGLAPTTAYMARDLWARVDLGAVTGQIRLQMRPHQCYLLRLTTR